MTIVDTHCHLDLDRFDEDRPDVFRRALDAGVKAMILIGYNPERWETTADLVARRRFLLRAVGIHPNDAGLWSDEIRWGLRSEVRSSSPVAIGEIGLDFFRSRDTECQQRVAFQEQLALANEVQLPVVIHQRMAEQEVLDIVDASPPVSGVMHCFGGDTSYAQRCVDRGFYLGIGGSVTYPKSDKLRDAVARMPLERMLLETDAPFLAPQGRRGKRNEPSLLVEVVREIAMVRNTTTDEIVEQTTANAMRLFGASIQDAITSGWEYQ